MVRLKGISMRIRLILNFIALILFTSTCISIFSYRASKNTIKMQSQELISGYLNQSVKRFDLFMENLHRASMSIAFNRDLNRILSRINEGNYEDYNNLLRINDLISTFNNTNRFVYLVNIYDFKNGVIIPSRGAKKKIDLALPECKLVNSLFIENNDAYKILYKWIEGRIVNLNGEEKNVLTFAIPIKDNYTGEIIGSVMTYVLEEHISSICKEVSLSSGGLTVIVNSKGRAISSSEPNVVGKEFCSYLNGDKQEHDSYVIKVDREEYLVSYRESSYIGWNFLSIVPIKVMMEKNIGVLKNTFIFIGLGTILLSFLLSYIINFYFYKPIAYLMNDIKTHIRKENLDLKPISRNDEIGFIFNSFYEILLENRSLMKSVYEQKILLQEAKIRLLYSQINPHFLYNSLDSIIWMLMFKQYDDIEILSSVAEKNLLKVNG
jgi:sensor histidine kinase YesM